jgi:hypothetical protein
MLNAIPGASGFGRDLAVDAKVADPQLLIPRKVAHLSKTNHHESQLGDPSTLAFRQREAHYQSLQTPQEQHSHWRKVGSIPNRPSFHEPIPLENTIPPLWMA